MPLRRGTAKFQSECAFPPRAKSPAQQTKAKFKGIKMEYRHETLAVHAGQVPDPATLARAVPVYRTTAYNFKSAKHGADLFALKESGNIYARLMNPTNDVLEKGAAALTFSSGTAAIAFTILNILRAGDELVSANNLYGGTYTQFDAILPQCGIKTRFAKVNDFAATEAAINGARAQYT